MENSSDKSGRINQGQHLLEFFQIQSAAGGQLFDLNHMLFDSFQVFFPYQFQVCSCHKAALAGHGGDKTVPLQFFIGTLGGNNADAQFFGQKTHGRQRVAFF